MTTKIGAIFTFMLAILLLIYAGMQLKRLLIYGETVVTMSVRDSFFTPDKTFSTEHGLDFAFALTAYDSNREPIEDPDYGIVRAKIV